MRNPISVTPNYWNQATTELSDRDPILGKLIDRYCGVSLRTRSDPFATLAKSIVGQQISIKAADSVWLKLVSNLNEINPESINSASETTLRSCGLSARKAIYLNDLALHFLSGSLKSDQFTKMDDEQVIVELTKVKGIGRWTAEMFLIFFLTRPNVLPLGDLGLQRAMAMHYGRGKTLSQHKLNSLSLTWVPWRSVATWYLWRSLDPIPVEY